MQANLQTAQASEDAGTLQVLKTLDSLETKIEQVRVAYQQFYTTMGIENVWKTGLDALKSYINTLNSLPKLFGKIPVNAINAIMGIVNLLKGIATSAINNFAKIWVNAVSEAKGEASNAATENKQNGNNWAEQFINGIKARIEDVRIIAREFGQAANAGVQESTNQSAVNVDNSATFTQLQQQWEQIKSKLDFSLEGNAVDVLPELQQLRSTLINLGVPADKLGDSIEQLKQTIPELLQDEQTLNAALSQNTRDRWCGNYCWCCSSSFYGNKSCYYYYRKN